MTETKIIGLMDALKESLSKGENADARWIPPGQGLFYDVEEHLYHNGPGVSQSLLKKLKDETPAHLKQALDDREANMVDNATPSQDFGSALHDALLQPDVFKRKWAFSPKGNEDKRLKKWKEWVKENPGVFHMKHSDGVQIGAIREKALANPIIRSVLESPTAKMEVSASWVDPDTGVMVRGRVDVDDEERSWHLDVKSTDLSIATRNLRWMAKRRGWHVQAGCYRHGWEVLGQPRKRTMILAVEMSEPHSCRLFRMDEASVLKGMIDYRKYLEEYAKCKELGEWPDYGEDIETLTIPD